MSTRPKQNYNWVHFENGIAITLYMKDSETPFMVHTPKIELYFKSLRDAIFYLKDKRRIRAIRRYQKLNNSPF